VWAAYGINRPDGGPTAPTAINAQEIDVFAALPTGAYLYDAAKNVLKTGVENGDDRKTRSKSEGTSGAFNMPYLGVRSIKTLSSSCRVRHRTVERANRRLSCSNSHHLPRREGSARRSGESA
jgi:hypothetical protein